MAKNRKSKVRLTKLELVVLSTTQSGKPFNIVPPRSQPLVPQLPSVFELAILGGAVDCCLGKDLGCVGAVIADGKFVDVSTPSDIVNIPITCLNKGIPKSVSIPGPVSNVETSGLVATGNKINDSRKIEIGLER